MARGPAPTPTNILKQRGSWRADARKDEPAATGELICPSSANEKVRTIWNEIVERMKRLQIGGEVDGPLLLELCKTMEEAERIEEILSSEGMFLRVNKRGIERGTKITVSVPHPLLRRRDKVREVIYRLAQQFGFSPASRTRVKKEAKEEADPLSDFLNEPSEN